MEEWCDMFHPDYGWIRVDNVTTEQGLKFFKDQRERYGSRNKNKQNNSSFELVKRTPVSKRDFN